MLLIADWDLDKMTKQRACPPSTTLQIGQDGSPYEADAEGIDIILTDSFAQLVRWVIIAAFTPGDGNDRQRRPTVDCHIVCFIEEYYIIAFLRWISELQFGRRVKPNNKEPLHYCLDIQSSGSSHPS